VLDEAGVSMQVLSLDGPGADLFPSREGAAWAREANDALAGLVAAPAWRICRLRGPVPPQTGSSGASSSSVPRSGSRLH